MKFKNTSFLAGILALTACTGNAELERLKKENAALIEKVNALESQKNDFSIIPYSTLDCYDVKQGDEIYHHVALALVNLNNKPSVFIKNPETGKFDVLSMENGFNTAYRIKTDRKGEYTIEGKVKYRIRGREKEDLFQTTYKVK